MLIQLILGDQLINRIEMHMVFSHVIGIQWNSNLMILTLTAVHRGKGLVS